MDPNACLERIESWLQKIGAQEARADFMEELDTACSDLYEWLKSGGFEPRWLEHLEAAGHFKMWRELPREQE
jgi:hypothetical protein